MDTFKKYNFGKLTIVHNNDNNTSYLIADELRNLCMTDNACGDVPVVQKTIDGKIVDLVNLRQYEEYIYSVYENVDHNIINMMRFFDNWVAALYTVDSECSQRHDHLKPVHPIELFIPKTYLKLMAGAIHENFINSNLDEEAVYLWFDMWWGEIFVDFETWQLTKRDNMSKHRPDRWMLHNGEYVPVEMKFGKFDQKALNQLQRYMKVYGCKEGIAVAEEFTVDLPKNVYPVRYKQEWLEDALDLRRGLLNEEMRVLYPEGKERLDAIYSSMDEMFCQVCVDDQEVTECETKTE